MSPVRYGLFIPEDGIHHSHRRGNLKSYTITTSVVIRILILEVFSCLLSPNNGNETIKYYKVIQAPSCNSHESYAR
jgi:hypothetical protein